MGSHLRASNLWVKISAYPRAAADYPWAASDFTHGQHANCSLVMLQQTMSCQFLCNHSGLTSMPGEYPIGNGFMQRLAGPLLVFGMYANVAFSACMAINHLVMFKPPQLYDRLFSPTQTHAACGVCALCGTVWAMSAGFDWSRIVFDLHLKKWLCWGYAVKKCTECRLRN